MKISLVIPAYNEEKYIGACLESVRRHGAGLLEVIVINNASTDKTEEVARAFGGVRVVAEPEKGLTKARQRGLTEARGDIIAFIDADTKMPEGWVEKVTQAFAGDERAVCVSGPYIYYDLSPVRRLAVWYYYSLLALPAYFFTGYMITGGNFAAKKSALEAVGGFDPAISFYGEDTDIARRLHAVGKVTFLRRLSMPTSARRFHGEGLWQTALKYMANFFSMAVVKKPLTHTYSDIRLEGASIQETSASLVALGVMKEYVHAARGIYYRTNEFRPGRKTLVFVHGLTGSSSAWVEYEQQFAPDYNILAFDLIGHGKSAKPKTYEEYHMDRLVDDLHTLMNHLGVERCTLISHSFGALIALSFLGRHQDKVEANIFMSPHFAVARMKSMQMAKPFLLLASKIALMLPPPRIRGHIDYSFYVHTGDWNLRRMFADIRNTGVRTHLYYLRQSSAFDGEDILARIEMPTLIIHGKKDTLFPPRWSQLMAGKIKNVKTVFLEGANHIIVLNNTREVIEAMEDFMKVEENL